MDKEDRDTLRQREPSELGEVTIHREDLLELLDSDERLVNVIKFAQTMAPIPGPKSTGGLFKSVPDHPKLQEMAQGLIGNVVQILRQEIEHQPVGKRNRISVNIMWNDETWNLTLAKDHYESVMEKQRDQAREEVEYWMKRALGPTEQPKNNDHEQDGD